MAFYLVTFGLALAFAAAQSTVCNFRFCNTDDTTVYVDPSDVAGSAPICLKNGPAIGTVDESGEAYLMDGTFISKYAPAGLKQRFSPSFFKAYALKPKYKYSGIGYETPQQNQADFIKGKTFILPLKVFQVLDKTKKYVVDEKVGGPRDCIIFKIPYGSKSTATKKPSATYTPAVKPTAPKLEPSTGPELTVSKLPPAPVATTAPTVSFSGDKCNFRFCVAAPKTFSVGKSIDVSFTGKICHKYGKLIGTVDQSGEAYLMDGTLISKYAPAGLKQPFSDSFFKMFSLKPEHKYSGIGHETPQQNQGDFLNGKTWILPMKVFQILNEKGEVIDEVVGGKYDCIKFSTGITPPAPTPAITEPPALPPPLKTAPPTAPPVAPPVKTVSPVAPPVENTFPVAPIKVCKFRFCTGPIEFNVGKSNDTPFTGKICHKDKLIGTVDESGEATLEDGTPISKYSPAGLTQKFSPAFFRTSPIKATKYVYSGIAHQLPQQNQGQYLDGKTWILPLKAYQVLNSKGQVIAELQGGKYDCVKFSTKI